MIMILLLFLQNILNLVLQIEYKDYNLDNLEIISIQTEGIKFSKKSSGSRFSLKRTQNYTNRKVNINLFENYNNNITLSKIFNRFIYRHAILCDNNYRTT